MRGSRHDFDGWAKEGYQGWSYKDGLPYFIKLEDIQIPSLKNSGINFTIQYEVLKFEKDKKKKIKGIKVPSYYYVGQRRSPTTYRCILRTAGIFTAPYWKCFFDMLKIHKIMT